jgi:septal ring factor EnvC (AmiA/AmiB activator)
MTHSRKSLGFLLVVLLGAYGCAKGPAGSPDNRLAAAEAKAQRLEEDFRAAAAARDSFRQRLIVAEEKLAQIQSSATQDRKDRDAARAELKARTAERDTLQVQYESFRTNLKELLGQAETALNQPGGKPPVLVGSQVSPGESNHHQ